MLASDTGSTGFHTPRPDQWVERLPGKWIGPSELYHAVIHSEPGQSRAVITGAEEAETALSQCSVESDRAVALEGVRIRIAADEYQIRYGFESRHVYGQGGQAIHFTFLDKNGLPVLESVAVISYDTYTDDSEDHEDEVSKSENTYLLGNGELERAVFVFLKRPELLCCRNVQTALTGRSPSIRTDFDP
jgi:hypothetical protein